MQHDRSQRGRARKSLGLSLVARCVVVVAALGIFVGSANAHPAGAAYCAYEHPAAPPTALAGGLNCGGRHQPGHRERLHRHRRRVAIGGRPIANTSPYACVGIGGHCI